MNTRRPVTTNSIRTSAITTAKIATGAVTTDKLNQTAGSQAVTTETIRDLAVTSGKIANGANSSAKLDPNFTFNGGTGTFQNLTATNFTFKPTNFLVNEDWSTIANSPINHLGVVQDAYMGLRRNLDGTTAFSIYPYNSGASGMYTGSIVQLKELNVSVPYIQSLKNKTWMTDLEEYKASLILVHYCDVILVYKKLRSICNPLLQKNIESVLEAS